MKVQTCILKNLNIILVRGSKNVLGGMRQGESEAAYDWSVLHTIAHCFAIHCLVAAAYAFSLHWRHIEPQPPSSLVCL